MLCLFLLQALALRPTIESTAGDEAGLSAFDASLGRRFLAPGPSPRPAPRTEEELRAMHARGLDELAFCNRLTSNY